MEEKYMVNDVLEDIRSEILVFTDSLINSENVEVRQVFEELRSGFEAYFQELFILATSKGYYTLTNQAKPNEIERNQKRIYLISIGAFPRRYIFLVSFPHFFRKMFKKSK